MTFYYFILALYYFVLYYILIKITIITVIIIMIISDLQESKSQPGNKKLPDNGKSLNTDVNCMIISKKKQNAKNKKQKPDK